MKRLKLLRTGLVLGVALLAQAGMASAATLTWSMAAPTGLTDLQHQQAYTWRIDGIAIDSTQITGATLKFNGFYNWTTVANDPYNVLFADLLDTAIYSGVKGGADSTAPSTMSKYDIDDAFRTSGTQVTGGSGTNYNANSLYTGGGGVSALVSSTTFTSGTTYIGSSYNASIAAMTATERANNGYVIGQTGYVQGSPGTNAGPFGTSAVNWQLDFNSTALNSLKNYLAGTDDTIAIGLDADCHFYDSSIVLEIYYNQTGGGSAVPEPGTMLLVGSGLLAAYRRRRRATV